MSVPITLSATVSQLALQNINVPTENPAEGEPPSHSVLAGLVTLTCGAEGTLTLTVGSSDMTNWVPGTAKTVTIQDVAA